MSSEYSLADHELASEILGPDLLAWLWYKTEKQDHVGGCGLVMGDRLCLENKETKEKVSISGEAADLAEGKLALKKGLRVYTAQFEVTLEDDSEYRFTLNGVTGAVSGLKMPSTGNTQDDDPDGATLEKVALVETFFKWFDKAFSEYVLTRMDKDKWATETKAMLEWLKKK